jgi:hypothetical protein
LSHKGHAEVMRDSKYLPLTAEDARKQLTKLDEETGPVELEA